MQKKFISIVALYLYTQQDNYENLLHLVFAVPDYPQNLLNEINLVVKAANTQAQYVLEKQMKILKPTYGDALIEKISLKDREFAIEEKVENIVALDIAILKFISSVPDRIEQNSFQLPQNADVPYLIGEYISIREKQMVSRISRAYELFRGTEFSDSFQLVPKIPTVVFNNNKYLTRVEKNEVVQLNKQEEHDYYLLINFLNHFFENSNNRQLSAAMNTSSLPSYLTYSADLRQILYMMASTFDSTGTVHKNLTNFFYNIDPNLDQSETFEGPKRKLLSQMTMRESVKNTNNILSLFVTFMLVEENNDINQVEESLPQNIIEYRNQFILILNRMIEHLIKYMLYKGRNKKGKMKYSTLPLIETPPFDPQKRPISYLLYIIQYALNFAPFLSSSSL